MLLTTASGIGSTDRRQTGPRDRRSPGCELGDRVASKETARLTAPRPSSLCTSPGRYRCVSESVATFGSTDALIRTGAICGGMMSSGLCPLPRVAGDGPISGADWRRGPAGGETDVGVANGWRTVVAVLPRLCGRRYAAIRSGRKGEGAGISDSTRQFGAKSRALSFRVSARLERFRSARLSRLSVAPPTVMRAASRGAGWPGEVGLAVDSYSRVMGGHRAPAGRGKRGLWAITQRAASPGFWREGGRLGGEQLPLTT